MDSYQKSISSFEHNPDNNPFNPTPALATSGFSPGYSEIIPDNFRFKSGNVSALYRLAKSRNISAPVAKNSSGNKDSTAPINFATIFNHNISEGNSHSVNVSSSSGHNSIPFNLKNNRPQFSSISTDSRPIVGSYPNRNFSSSINFTSSGNDSNRFDSVFDSSSRPVLDFPSPSSLNNPTNIFESDARSATSAFEDEDVKSVYSCYTEATDFLRVDPNNNNVSPGFPIAVDTKENRDQDILDHYKKSILPYELSTLENEIQILGLTSNNLKRTIIEIWLLSQVHNREKRITNLAWYNWVLLDIARRLAELDVRAGSRELLYLTIAELSERIFFDGNADLQILDKKPFTKNPLFLSKPRARLIRLAHKFGDAICAISDLIDFMYVLHMTDEEFDIFYAQLKETKKTVGTRINMFSSIFKSGNPRGPFSGTGFTFC